MADQRSIAVEYASELSNPFRVRLVAALIHGPRNVTALAEELSAAEAVVRHHLERLRKLGIVEEDDDPDGERTYAMIEPPVVWSGEWAELPADGRRNAAASALTSIGARAAAAIDRGGFDRGDIHITRTTITVDEARWSRLAELFDTFLRDLQEREADPAPAGPAFRATGTLILYTDEVVERPAPPAVPQHDEEALSAADALLDGLSGALVESPVDWEAVEVLAERLRLVARGSKQGPGAAPVIPLRRDEAPPAG